jgi:hypothetical protein
LVGAVRGGGPTGGAATGGAGVAGGAVKPGPGIVTVPGGNPPGVTTVPCCIVGISPNIGPSEIGIPSAGGQVAGSGLLRWNSIGRLVLLHPPAPSNPAVTISPVPHVRPMRLTSPHDPAAKHRGIPGFAQESIPQ